MSDGNPTSNKNNYTMDESLQELLQSYHRRLTTHSPQCHRHRHGWIKNQKRPNSTMNGFYPGAYSVTAQNGGDYYLNESIVDLDQTLVPSNIYSYNDSIQNGNHGNIFHEGHFYSNGCHGNLIQGDRLNSFLGYGSYDVHHARQGQGHNCTGDLYSVDLGSPKGVVLREVRRMEPPSSPVVERRKIVRQPRPVTSPIEIRKFNIEAEYDRKMFGRGSLNSDEKSSIEDPNVKDKTSLHLGAPPNPVDTQSLNTSPVTMRKCPAHSPLQRYKSVSPTFGRKRVVDKLSPASLRKSVILRSSRKSEPVMLDMCHSCGFPLREENHVSVTNKAGKRHVFHGECFKCSLKSYSNRRKTK